MTKNLWILIYYDIVHLNNNYRLTLQLSGERAVCSRKEICLPVGEIPRPEQDSPLNTDALGSNGNSDVEIRYVNIASKEVEVGSGVLGENDTGTDDEDMVMQMIKENYQTVDNDMIVTADKGCLVTQEFFTKYDMPWIPECDCKGNYKAVQCVEVKEELQCWCSTPSGSEIHNSRRTLNCTVPETL